MTEYLSLHSLFIAATWLIGLFGVGGAVAMIAAVIFLGPAAVVAVIEPLIAKFMSCLWCIVAAVFLLATVGSYWVGHHTAVVACREDQLAAALRNKQIDLDNAKKAKDDETERANKIEVGANDQHEKDAAYIEQLKNRPDTACVLDDPDLLGVPNHQSGPGGAKPASHPR